MAHQSLAVAGSFGDYIDRTARESFDFAAISEATNVGPVTIDGLERDVRYVARRYLSAEPLPQIPAAVRVRDQAFELLKGRQAPAFTERLYLVAGQACGLLAWMTGDVGSNREAETHARSALLFAELAGSTCLRAWVRATQSKLAYWDDRVPDSVRLAEDGLALRTADSGAVLLAGLAARAHAALGARRDAERALAEVRRRRDEIDRDDEVGGVYGFSTAQQHYLTGTSYLWLDLPDKALRETTRAVGLFESACEEERFTGAETLARIDAAVAQVRVGELEAALDALDLVFALPPERRLDTARVRLADVRALLADVRFAGSPIARELRERIRDFREANLTRIVRATA